MFVRQWLFILFFVLVSASLSAASSGEPIRITYPFSPPQIGKVNSYWKVTMPGCVEYGQPGKPVLPFKTAQILIPYGEEVTDVKVICGQRVDIAGKYLIEPGQMPVPLSYKGSAKIISPEKTIYDSSLPFPAKVFLPSLPQAKKGYRILLVTLYPVSYMPMDEKISYYKELTVEVSTSPLAKAAPSLSFSPRVSPGDSQEIRRMVDNPEVVEGYSMGRGLSRAPSFLTPGQYDYVIITNEELCNSTLEYNFQRLAAHKNNRGIKTTIVTTEWIYANYDGTRPDGGTDNQTRIRNFIIDAYKNWGIEYVLLGGDGDGADVGGESGDDIIPHRGFYCAGEDLDEDIPSDLYYACLDGSFDGDADGRYGEPHDGQDGGDVDLYAEVYVGRAPVDSSEELSNFVRKTIGYETTVNPKNALMVGELLWTTDPPTFGGDYKDEIKNGTDTWGYTTAGFSEDWEVNTLYDRDIYPSEWSKTDLIPLINNGLHIINHLGHSNVDYNMRMKNEDVDTLLTNDTYFFGYSQGCYNGAFDNRSTDGEYFAQDAIAEHFVVGMHGAFAFVGNSRYGWGMHNSTNGPSQYFDRQFFDALFGEKITNLGKINQDSKEDNIGFIGVEYPCSMIRWCYYDLNLFGDPQTSLVGISSEGKIILNNDYYASGEMIQMSVTDANLNTNSATKQRYKGIVGISASGGDVEQAVEIIETGPDTSFFTGSILLSGNSPQPNNGQLEAKQGEIIRVSYLDADNGSGHSATMKDTATVTFRSTISGCVIGMDTGMGIASAVIHYTGPLSGEVNANEYGSWTLAGLPDGKYLLLASASGYPDSDKAAVVVPPDAVVPFRMGIPDISISPGLFTFTIPQGSKTTGQMIISNKGSGNLEFKLITVEDGWLNWLSVSPDAGIVPAGSQTIITMDIDSGKLGTGYYNATVILHSNSVNEGTITVPVILSLTPAFNICLDNTRVIGDTNNDGVASEGELVDLEVCLINIGDVAVEGVEAIIGTDDPWITLRDNFGNYSQIMAKETKGEPFGFRVNPFAPIHPATFTLRVTSSGRVILHEQFAIEIQKVPDISLSPSSFDITLAQGSKTTRAMTITNTGDGELDFYLLPYGKITPPAVPPLKMDEPASEQDIAEKFRSLIALHQENSLPDTSLNKSTGYLSARAVDILLIFADYPKPPTNIGSLLGKYADIGSVDYFDATEMFGETPPLSKLKEYDAVLVLSGPSAFADPEALGDVLADYVDAGGKVVLTVAAFGNGPWQLQGRLMTEKYSPFNSGEMYFNITNLGTFTPDHPIMTGVKQVSDGIICKVSLTKGAIPVALWDNGYPFVATKPTGVACVNGYVLNKSEWEGDMPLVLHNTITYLMGNWLSVFPIQGTITPGGSMEITMGIDPADLDAGRHYGTISVYSNDPDEEEVSVPVTMNLTPTYIPLVKYASYKLDREVIDSPDKPVQMTVSLKNTGNGTANNVFGTLTTNSPYITLLDNAADFGNILPNGTNAGGFAFSLMANCPANHQATFTLNFTEANGNTRIQEFVVTIKTTWQPVIDVSWNLFAAALPEGSITTRSLVISNKGKRDLSFKIGGMELKLLPVWLSVSPQQGTITADSSVIVTISFNSTNQSVGSHNVTMIIINNDPSQSLYPVYATMFVQPFPAIKYVSYTLIEDEDGIVSPGETVDIGVTLINSGVVNAYGLAATLTTFSTYTTILDNYKEIGTIAVGGIFTANFRFSLDPACPDGHLICFSLDITDSSGRCRQENLRIPAVCSDLSLAESVSSFSGYAGQSITYRLDYRNQGTASARSVRIIDQLPAGVEYSTDTSGVTPVISGSLSAGLVLSWDIGTIPGADGGSFYLIGTVSSDTLSGSTMTNYASITTTTPESNNNNNFASATAVIFPPAADIRIFTEVSSYSGCLGEAITYRIRYNNQGIVEAGKVTVIDQLPPYVEYATSTLGHPVITGSISTGLILTWQVGSLSACSPYAYIYLIGTVTDILSGNNSIINYASITTMAIENNYTNNRSVCSTQVFTFPKIEVTPLFFEVNVPQGQIGSRTLTIANTGREDLRFGIRFNTIGWLLIKPEVDRVIPGSMKDLTVTVDTAGLEPGTYTANIIIYSNDPDEGTITIPATVTVTPAPIITCICYNLDGDGIASAGETVNMMAILKNKGSLRANSVSAVLSVADKYLSITDNTGDFGNIPAGGITTGGTFTFNAASDCPNKHSAIFTLTITDADGHCWIDSFTVLIIKVPNIDVLPTAFNLVLPQGKIATQTVTVANIGQADLLFDVATDIYWLLAKPVTGMVTFCSKKGLTVTFDTTTLEPGDYVASIIIHSNDPDEAIVTIPVTMTVTPATIIAYEDYSLTGDGLASAGETVNMTISLKNRGGLKAKNVSAILSTASKYVTISDNNGAFGNIMPGETGSDTFIFSVSSSCPGNHSATFTLTITDADGYCWIDRFTVDIATPVIAYAGHILDGDDLVSAGETINMTVGLKNKGRLRANNVSAVLSTTDSYLSITDNNGDFGDILAGETANSSFTFKVASDCPDNHLVEFALNITDSLGGNWIGTFEITIFNPSQISAAPTSFEVALPQGETATRTITIRNDGIGDLRFTVALDSKKETSPPVPIDLGEPDKFGYTWKDSDEDYNWLDITENGTKITGLSDDDNVGPYDIGWTFPFYGNTFNTFRFCTNGWVSFTSNSYKYSNTSLPDTNAPYNLIAPFWDDLDFRNSGSAYYWSNGEDTLVISYINVPQHNAGGTYTFQIILKKSGKITYQYHSMSSLTDNATIGIQNESGNSGLTVAYNTAYVHDGLSVEIFPSALKAEWLEITPCQGTVAPGDSQDITLSFNSGKLSQGTYSQAIYIRSNDRQLSEIPIYATMTVAPIPVISLATYTLVADSNDDGILNPGETGTINVTLVNRGDCQAVDLRGSLTMVGNDVILYQNSFSFGTLSPQATVTLPFSFVVSRSTPEGEAVILLQLVDAEGMTWTESIRVSIVGKPEIVVTPGSLTISLEQNQKGRRNIIISNNGSHDLEFDISSTGETQAMILDDPTEGSLIDISRVEATVIGQELSFQIFFASPVPKEEYYDAVFIVMDVDQNSATGIRDAEFKDIGIEFFAEIKSFDGQWWVGFTNEDFILAGSFTLPFNSTNLSFSIPLSMLGNDDGNMDVIYETNGRDYVPDSGYGTIKPESANWLSASPSSGTISANASSTIMINFDGAMPPGSYTGSLLIQSNARDISIPVEMTIEAAPIIRYSAYTLNGDGIANPGEVVEMEITLVNNGYAEATNVNGILSSADTYITGALSASFGNITAGGTATGIFTLTIADSCPDNYQSTFTLGIRDSNNRLWEAEIILPVRKIPEILFTPDCFDVTIPQSGVGSRSMTITNSGSGDLRFNIYPQKVGRVALISDDTQLDTVSHIMDKMAISYHLLNDNRGNIYTGSLSLLAQYSTVVFYKQNRAISQQEYTALEAYLQHGGCLLVTGWDSLAEPADPLLAKIVRSTADYGDLIAPEAIRIIDGAHPITNGPYGRYPNGMQLTTGHYDHDWAEADTDRGAVTIAELPAGSDKIIATTLVSGGKVVYWNGNYACCDWTAKRRLLEKKKLNLSEQQKLVANPLSTPSPELANILKNTLVWLLKPEGITIQPEQGTITRGAQAEIAICFTQNKMPGVSLVDIKIISNAPANGLLLLSATITVNDMPPAPPVWKKVINLKDSGSIQLDWLSNSESDIAGYKIYYGTATGKYFMAIDTGTTAITCTLHDLTNNRAHYFSLTAYDKAGHESDKSEERVGSPTGPLAYLRIESFDGTEIGSRTITADEPLTVYSRGYTADGNPIGYVNGIWTVTGDIGEVNPRLGTATTLNVMKVGKGTIRFEDSVGHDDETDMITVGHGSISRIAFIVPPVVVTAGIHGTMTIQIQDNNGNASPATEATTIIVRGNEQSRFTGSVDGDKWTQTGSFILPSGVSQATFFFKQNGIATPVTITATGINTATTCLITIQPLGSNSSGSMVADDGKTMILVGKGIFNGEGWIEIDTSGISTEPAVIEANRANDEGKQTNRIEGSLRKFTPQGIANTFTTPVIITIPYSDMNNDNRVDGIMMDENMLSIYHLEGNNWVKVPDSRVDSQANTISAPVIHFSYFILMGPAFEPDLKQSYAYPNPYYSNQHKNIYFDRLNRDSVIRIFTISGELVREIKVENSPQEWDVCNEDGYKVASGIYLYLITDAEGNKKVGKLGVIQ